MWRAKEVSCRVIIRRRGTVNWLGCWENSGLSESIVRKHEVWIYPFFLLVTTSASKNKDFTKLNLN